MEYKVAAKIFGYFYVKYLWVHSIVGPFFLSLGMLIFLNPLLSLDMWSTSIGIISLIIALALGIKMVNNISDGVSVAYTNQVINQVPFRYKLTFQHYMSVILYAFILVYGIYAGISGNEILTNEVLNILIKIGILGIVAYFGIRSRVNKMKMN